MSNGTMMMPNLAYFTPPWSGNGRRMSVSTVSSGRYGGGISKTTTVKKRKRYIQRKNSLRRKIIATLPAKHNTFDANTSVLANSAYTLQPTRNIGQGTGNQDRLGDEIFLEALKIKGHFETTTDSNAYQFRMIVGFTGEETNGIASWSATGLTAAEVYQPNTFTVLTAGQINKKAITVLYDETFDINSQVEGAVTLHGYDVLVPIKQRFKYQSAGSTYGKTKNLFVWIVGFATGIAGANSVGTNYISCDLIFKD